MKTPRRALLLAALFLLPLLPAADALGPEPRAWSTYNALSEVNALAMAREGTTIAAALREAITSSSTATPSPVPIGSVPGVAASGALTDLAVLHHEHGFAQNLTYYDAAPPRDAPGRSHVAVSRDGTAIASLGIDYQQGTNAERARLHYARIESNGNWSTPGAFNRSIDLGAPAGTTGAGADAVTFVSLAISDDGRRVAALYGQSSQYVLRGFTFTGGALNGAFELRAPGTPRALAASGDLSKLVVAGQFPQNNFTYGGLHVLPFAQSTPLATWFDESANNTDARSVATTRDGSLVAAADGTGKVRVFRDAMLSDATLLNATAAPASLVLSENGARLAAFANATLVVYDTTAAPVQAWNATVPGQRIAAVAMDRTGGLVLVGSSGTGGAVVAYGEDDPRPLWQIPGDTRGVAMDSAGQRIAYAQRATIGAARVPQTFTMELAEGGKLAAQRIVTSPGNASFGVTLRNDGGATQRVVFEENAPGVSVAAAAPTLVRPGDIVRTNVTISIEPGLVGPRVFNLTARALGSGVVDNVTLSIAPEPTLDVKLFVNETDILAQAGKTTELLLTIVNNGTGDSAVALRATQTVSGGALWNLSLSDASMNVLRGTRATVKVLMSPPADVANGTSSTVDFTLEGAGIFDTARVVFRINPTLEVKVNATGVTKLIPPGERAFYNVTVTNTGSLPRQFELFYTVTSSDGRSWGVDMESQTTRLQPLERRVIPVIIVAPADAQPEERVSVLVSARSIPETVNETVVNDNVTLFGITIPPRVITPTPTGNPVPGFAPVAAIAAFALLGLLRRRPA